MNKIRNEEELEQFCQEIANKCLPMLQDGTPWKAVVFGLGAAAKIITDSARQLAERQNLFELADNAIDDGKAAMNDGFDAVIESALIRKGDIH